MKICFLCFLMLSVFVSTKAEAGIGYSVGEAEVLRQDFVVRTEDKSSEETLADDTEDEVADEEVVSEQPEAPDPAELYQADAEASEACPGCRQAGSPGHPHHPAVLQ